LQRQIGNSSLGKRPRENEKCDRAQSEAFSAIVQHGSFERAATVLNVTRGAVSQRIKALEESLTTVLLIRGKPVVSTPNGEILLRHVRTLKALEDDTFSAIQVKTARSVELEPCE
jgi:LysR family transcriptional regulator (chromosome initiation inhibitor)